MKILYSKIISVAILVNMLCLFYSSLLCAADFDDSISAGIEQPGWLKHDPFYDLAETLQSARAGGKQGLMIVFGTRGCSYCETFIKKSLDNPELASLARRKFESVYMEIFDDRDMVTPDGKTMSIKQFAKHEGIQFSPSLLFYDLSGKRTVRVIGYQSPERFEKILDFVSNKHYRTESLREHFKHHEAKAETINASYKLRQDPIFKSLPYDLMLNYFPQKNPELIIFEKPDCNACADFHDDVLALKQVRGGLNKFVVIRLDATDRKTVVRHPNGHLTNPAAWYKSTDFSRLPALVFYDEKGRKVLETDALVKHQRMMNAINYVLERAYKKDWTYQRFARTKEIERNLKHITD